MNKIIEFINDLKKLHPTEIEDVFTSGYCYWFAELLKARFPGKIVYHPIDNHFAFQSVFNDKIYDVTGEIDGTGFEDWFLYSKKDKLESNRIIRDCILKV